MSRLNYRHTNMDAESYNGIELAQQVNKYDALNTYKIKLCSTHAREWIPASTSETPGSEGTTVPTKAQSNPPGGLTWDLPVIPGNHINKCLIKVVGIHIPVSCLDYDLHKTSSETGVFQLEFDNQVSSKYDLLYITSNNVIQKTFVSSTHNGVFPKGILGSLNTSFLYKSAHKGELAKSELFGNIPIADGKNLIDNEYILAVNPFGSSINLGLIEPDTFTSPSIRCSKDGELGTQLSDASTVNNLLNVPVVYELEIKLLPDNQSNDKFSY